MEQGRMTLADGTVIGWVLLPRRRFLSWTLWTTIVQRQDGTIARASWNFLFRRSARAKLGATLAELIDLAESQPLGPPPALGAERDSD